MKKRNGEKKSMSKKSFYSLIALGVIFLFAGVLALTPGVAPDNGHTMNLVSPPSPCSAGQVIQWEGTSWSCVSIGGSTATNWNSYTPSGSSIHFGVNNQTDMGYITGLFSTGISSPYSSDTFTSISNGNSLFDSAGNQYLPDYKWISNGHIPTNWHQCSVEVDTGGVLYFAHLPSSTYCEFSMTFPVHKV